MLRKNKIKKIKIKLKKIDLFDLFDLFDIKLVLAILIYSNEIYIQAKV